LKGQGLAGPGRHDRERIETRQTALDNLRLTGAQLVITKDVANGVEHAWVDIRLSRRLDDWFLLLRRRFEEFTQLR
jgi:hypothetical protein